MIEIRDITGKFPGALKWSGKGPIPAIGSEIEITMNGIGKATVVGYFMAPGEEGTFYLGVRATPHNPPQWYVDQNGENHAGHVYGAEIEVPG